MQEWIKNAVAAVKERWLKWTLTQRVLLIGIAAAAVAALVFVFSFSARPTTVPVFDVAVTDGAARDNIVYRLEQENVAVSVSGAGVISVKDEATARRMRAILVREDLVPGNVDPWALFDIQRWTVTDMQEKVNVQRSITQAVKQHIEALDDIDRANVVITIPQKQLFSSQQSPATASVIIYPRPGSGIREDKKKIQGIQKLLLMAVEGLKAENVSIADSGGLILNDFEGMAASEAVDIVAKQQKLIAQLEGKYRTDVLIALQKIFGEDRVRDLNIKIDMDMSKKQAQTTEYSAIVITPDNPDTPYDDSLTKEYLPLASETITKEWNGTFYSPEGPAGTAGQNPPVYADMTNQIGTSRETSAKQNNAINTKQTQEEKSPAIDRVTVSVNIDGAWKRKYDEKGNLLFTPSGSIDREYVPVDAQSLTQAASLVQGAVGYNRTRGDQVSVTNIAFDRSAQFDTEDAAFRRTRQTRFAFLMVFAAIAAAIVLIVVIRLLAGLAKRRRERREEEAIRQPDPSIWNNMEIDMSMSEEDRHRVEMQEQISAMAKDHPEDVAQLLRTWMTED